MKAGWVLAILIAGIIGGCTSSGTSSNPNLLAPKAILAARADGNATIFVHSAFGDHQYDWIEVALDNRSLGNKTDTYSFEEDVSEPHYFLEITAGAGQQQYHMRARVDITAKGEKAVVSIEDERGRWSDSTFSLPWEHIMDRKVAP